MNRAICQRVMGCCAWARLVLLSAGLLSSLLLPLSLGAAESVSWGSGSYTYFAVKSPLNRVLLDFCNNYGLRLKMDHESSAIVNGRLSAESPNGFLDQLATTYGFEWFYQDGSIFVVRKTDWARRTMPVSAPTMANLRKALLDLKLLDERFGWAELPEQGMVVLSGPRDYVTMIAEAIESLNLAPSGMRVAVFRLRYATVDDRTITIRDRQVTMPGATTLLRNLLSGLTQDRSTRAVAATENKNQNLGQADIQMFPDKVGNVKSPPPARANNPSGPTVESDTRLNAILIKDAPEMMPVYEKLIAMIDVPTALVEIEAMIVDVSKSRMRELGIDWTVTGDGSRYGYSNLGGAASNINFALSNLELGGSSAVLGNITSLLANIRALETEGDAKVIGKPMIITMDNQGAIIDLSQTYNMSVSGERVANVVPITAGVMLKVTPHVISQEEGRPNIHLLIDIEDGSLIERGASPPIVQRSTISTQAIIQQSQSLLIGGYDSEANSESVEQVPILGSLPYIGHLFKSTNKKKEKRERLFLITPRVLASSMKDMYIPDRHDWRERDARRFLPSSAQTPKSAAPPPAEPVAVSQPIDMSLRLSDLPATPTTKAVTQSK